MYFSFIIAYQLISIMKHFKLLHFQDLKPRSKIFKRFLESSIFPSKTDFDGGLCWVDLSGSFHIFSLRGCCVCTKVAKLLWFAQCLRKVLCLPLLCWKMHHQKAMCIHNYLLMESLIVTHSSATGQYSVRKQYCWIHTCMYFGHFVTKVVLARPSRD